VLDAAALASLLIAQACGDDGQITSTIQDQNCMNDLQCETACEGIVCMDRPVNYREVADYLQRTRGSSSIDIPSKFYSNWMDNDKAKYFLGWRPQYDMEKLVDSAWEYVRPENESRTIWYPG